MEQELTDRERDLCEAQLRPKADLECIQLVITTKDASSVLNSRNYKILAKLGGEYIQKNISLILDNKWIQGLLSVACRVNNLPVVKELWKYLSQEDINSAFKHALKSDNLELIKLFSSVTVRREHVFSFIRYSKTQNQSEEIMDYLLRELKLYPGEQLGCLISSVVWKKYNTRGYIVNMQLIIHLIKQGHAPIQIFDFLRNIPFKYYPEVIYELRKHGTVVSPSDFTSVLNRSVLTMNIDDIKMLCEHGAKVDLITLDNAILIKFNNEIYDYLFSRIDFSNINSRKYPSVLFNTLAQKCKFDRITDLLNKYVYDTVSLYTVEKHFYAIRPSKWFWYDVYSTGELNAELYNKEVDGFTFHDTFLKVLTTVVETTENVWNTVPKVLNTLMYKDLTEMIMEYL